VHVDPNENLFENERERRLKSIPRMRLADQIDISSDQLRLLKEIYDDLPKASGVDKDCTPT
jgi:hypothetical protein